MPKRSDVSAAPSASGKPSQAIPSIRARLACVVRRITAHPPVAYAPDCLASLEKLVLHQFMQQRTDASALFFGAGDDIVQCRAVAEGNLAAGGVDGELAGKVLQERARLGRQ